MKRIATSLMVLKNTIKALVIALLTLVTASLAQAEDPAPADGDIKDALAVVVGDSFQTLAAKLKGRLEPDLCDSVSYARALGWSCEGYQTRGLRASGIPMRARFSLDATGTKVRSIVVVLDGPAEAARRSDDAIVGACTHLAQSIQGLYVHADGTGQVPSGSTRIVQHFMSRDNRAVATLVCATGTAGALGDVALVIDATEARPDGRRSVAAAGTEDRIQPVTTLVGMSLASQAAQ